MNFLYFFVIIISRIDEKNKSDTLFIRLIFCLPFLLYICIRTRIHRYTVYTKFWFSCNIYPGRFWTSIAKRQTNDRPVVQILIGLTTTCPHQHNNKSPTSSDTAFTRQEMDGDEDTICLSPARRRHYWRKDN